MTSTPDTSQVSRGVLAGIALVSAALLMTELSLTRIFSVTMLYHFAFLAISIALFGLSASGVYVYLSRGRVAAIETSELLSRRSLGAAVVTVASLAVLLHLPLKPYNTGNAVGLLTITYIVAALPFFAGGLVIALAMTRLSAQVNRVYAADLLGASGACLLLMPALNQLGAPGAIVFSACLAAVAAVGFAGRPRRSRTAVWAVGFVVVVATLGATPLRPFSLGAVKGHEQYTVLFSKWNSFSRIGVYDQPLEDWSLSPRFSGHIPKSHLMDIDAAAATQILNFRGDLQDVSYLKYELTALGYRLVGGGGPTPRPFHALIIGTGGGRDLLSALVYGATTVDGVEINPIIVNDVMRDRFREYSGDIYNHPGVRIHIEDGRSFVRRSTDRFDLIQASLVDTWAATAAGAYTLTENSLYTVEAFEDYLDHLTDRGVLSITRWTFDGLRLVALAHEACARRGVELADRIAIVMNDRVATFLLKKTPFTDAERALLLHASEELAFVPLYVPGMPPAVTGDERDDYSRLILASDPQTVYDELPVDVSPTTDDRPFYFHTARLRDQPMVAAVLRLLGRPPQTPADAEAWALHGPGVLIALLGISLGLVVLFVIGPLAVTSRDALTPGWFGWLSYFACLGAGFMLIEVALLQRFVLLLGHPVYSLTTTLLALLLGTGIGSALSRRVSDGRIRRAGTLACFTIILIAVLWATVLPSAIRFAIAWPLGLRIAVAVVAMLPAGMVMGVPLPAGVRLLRVTNPDLVAWGWGLNGALSVVGATLAVFIAMNAGFSVTLLCGAALYAVAALLVSGLG
ncbi:MAG TPA: hypothetical protein VH458_16985 [Vicinamibacterales bacterium]|jgi:hypothetical protein